VPCALPAAPQIGAFEDVIFSKRMRELRRQKDRVARQRYVS
jgi:5'-3' exoribonuclease 2